MNWNGDGFGIIVGEQDNKYVTNQFILCQHTKKTQKIRKQTSVGTLFRHHAQVISASFLLRFSLSDGIRFYEIGVKYHCLYLLMVHLRALPAEVRYLKLGGKKKLFLNSHSLGLLLNMNLLIQLHRDSTVLFLFLQFV